MKNLNVYKSYGELHRAGLDFVFANVDKMNHPANANATQDLIENGVTYVAEFCCNTLYDKQRLSTKYFHFLDQALPIADDVPPDPVDTPHDQFTQRKALIQILRMIESVPDFREQNLQTFERRYVDFVKNAYIDLPAYFFIAAENVKAQAGFLLTRTSITDQTKSILKDSAIASIANEHPGDAEKVVFAALARGVCSIIIAEAQARLTR